MTGEVLGSATLRGKSPTCCLTALFNTHWPATLTRTLEVLALLTLHPPSEQLEKEVGNDKVGGLLLLRTNAGNITLIKLTVTVVKCLVGEEVR